MSKRVDIKTGFNCNNNCLFCVQGWRKDVGNRPTSEIYKDLDAAKKTDCEGVVFTGGEVTIRNDFLELLRYARDLEFETIQVQSNARRFAYKDFCKKAIEAGMTELGPALHGHIPELHDYLTRSPGSFKQGVQAIKNIKELGLYVVSNTVIVKPNYRYLPEIAQMFVDLKANQFQFAFVHAVGTAGDNFDQMVPWVSLAEPFIKKGLQIGLDNGLKVMAEAMPFCVMQGYEKYVSELYIPETEIRDGQSYDPNFTKTRAEQGKVKFPQCAECKYDLICEGPWKEYPKNRGHEEFKPVPGKKIKSMDEVLKA